MLLSVRARVSIRSARFIRCNSTGTADSTTAQRWFVAPVTQGSNAPLPLQISLLQPSVVATLPEIAIIGWTSSRASLEPETARTDDFIACSAFETFLHEVLSSITTDATTLAPLAAHQKEGWLHVADERNPAPWGRIPVPEDIFGSVLLSNGTVVAGSYQRNPTHRLISRDGLFQLSEEMHQRLLEHLRKRIAQMNT